MWGGESEWYKGEGQVDNGFALSMEINLGLYGPFICNTICWGFVGVSKGVG